MIQCSNCRGPHPPWNKKECEVRQAAIIESHKKRAELEGKNNTVSENLIDFEIPQAHTTNDT